MRRNPFCTFVLGGLGLAAPLVAQTARPLCELWLRDGRVVPADLLEGAATGEWVATFGRQKERVRAEQVLAVLGARSEPSSLPCAHLAGGDAICGLLVGGDEAGDELQLQSPVLGRVRIAVDRLECFVAKEGIGPEALELPSGVQEALFFAAAFGFDRQAGTLHRFGSEGIRFESVGDKAPRWVAVRDLVGLRLSGAAAPEGARVAELCTRSCDRVGLSDFRFDGAVLRGKCEGAPELSIALTDVGCLLRSDTAVQHLSRLEPKVVAEAAMQGDALWPMRRDRAVTGTPLVANGRTVARGLGVHSRSRVVHVVPEGAAQFLSWVAFDDAAMQLPVRGQVEVVVQVGSQAPTRLALAAGDEPRRVGPLAVRPGEEISLEVDFGKGRDLGDRVDWLLPVFLPGPASR